jgi:hypothetical protein
MSEYDKKYIKWIVLVFVLGILAGQILKALASALLSGVADPLYLTWMLDLITPFLIIMGLFVVLWHYQKNKS